MALDTKGTVREARGLTSRMKTSSSWIANCTFISPRTPSASPAPHLLAHLVLHRLGQGVGRQRAGGVAGVHAGLLDVLHDAADQHLLAVADRVDVDLDGVVQEAVQQHRRSRWRR
jgi:hypothetical protein